VSGQPLSVAVIGCGSAGPAAALFLARLGHRVEIVERAQALGPVGAGFLLQPTGMSVLAELGLLDEVLALGAPVRHLVSETRSGRRILNLSYDELGPGLFGLGLHRPGLMRVLTGALERAGVPIRLGTTITDVAVEADGRARLVDQHGDRRGPFDLVVVANGARCELRNRLVSGCRAPRYPWGALWFVGEDSAGLGGDRLFQRVDGSARMMGTLPTGRERYGGPPLVSLFWSFRLAQLEQLRAAGLEALKADMRRLSPAIEPLLAPIARLEELTVAEYHDVRMPRWSKGPVVFLGDAAHAMSPQLGQGVNLALWDAQTLADCLRATATRSDGLALYQHSRRHHLSFYQRMTRWLTPAFQSSWPLVGWGRDLTFPLLHRFGFFRREMVRTMAGLKRGVLRRTLALPWPPPSKRLAAGPEITLDRLRGG
jgi:2-polyprenyl-6-methoxyphenol hydroxylase-like FAD-dependent oxidoreductase